MDQISDKHDIYRFSIGLNYDRNRDMIINSHVETEEQAIGWKELNRLLRSVKEIVEHDAVILQLMMMIILVFVRGASL